LGVVRIGISGGADFDRLAGQVEQAEADGLASMWFSGAIGVDPLVVIAGAGRESKATKIELGTSVVQTYPSHPVLMAQRAAAVSAAIPGRFSLGLGVSHRPGIEGVYGLPYERPAAHMREYLSIVRPLLSGERVDFTGDFYEVHAEPRTKPASTIPILVAALAPAMMRVTGELAEGTITWMTNRKAVETHIAPRLGKAAADVGRPGPRIVVGLPVAVCDEAEGREAAAKQFAGYEQLPNYRKIMDIGGVEGPGDVAVVGDEATVAKELSAIIEAGGTDIWAAIFPVGEDHKASRKRTRDLLRELVKHK
jgi:F420-dependent oxidoreductase-like protein